MWVWPSDARWGSAVSVRRERKAKNEVPSQPFGPRERVQNLNVKQESNINSVLSGNEKLNRWRRNKLTHPIIAHSEGSFFAILTAIIVNVCIVLSSLPFLSLSPKPLPPFFPLISTSNFSHFCRENYYMNSRAVRRDNMHTPCPMHTQHTREPATYNRQLPFERFSRPSVSNGEYKKIFRFF